MQQLQDYYQILGVSRQATEMEIRQAFRTLAKALHPDRPRTETQTTTNHDFRTINEAYETLKDREKRRAYDEELLRARTVVRHLDARQNSPRAFATGLTFGLVIALIGIAVMMYSDRLPFRKMRAKAQDLLNSSITAHVQRTPKAQDNRQVTAQSPTIETSKPETENLTEIAQQLSNSEQNAAADNDEALPGKAQNRLGSDLTPPSSISPSEQKTASLESDPSIRSDASTVQAHSRALSVKDRDAVKEEVSPLASLAKPNQAILSRAISNTEANIDKGSERAGQALKIHCCRHRRSQRGLSSRFWLDRENMKHCCVWCRAAAVLKALPIASLALKWLWCLLGNSLWGRGRPTVLIASRKARLIALPFINLLPSRNMRFQTVIGALVSEMAVAERHSSHHFWRGRTCPQRDYPGMMPKGMWTGCQRRLAKTIVSSRKPSGSTLFVEAQLRPLFYLPN